MQREQAGEAQTQVVVAVVAHSIPKVPGAVSWRNGMVLEPADFIRTDARSAGLTHLAALIGDPWPWGFLHVEIDETALAGGELRVQCDGVFPDGTPFEQTRLNATLPKGEQGDALHYDVARAAEHDRPSLQLGGEAPSETNLPVARLVWRGGVWGHAPDWSPPALLIGPEHPLRADINRDLGALAALGVGFVATLRMPGAENRPVARVLGQVAVTLSQGVGVIDALMAAPAVSPGRVGMEALRLALGLRTAAGVFEPMDGAWSPSDQRGSMRYILGAAQAAASGVGLPFRANVFQAERDKPGVLKVDVVSGRLLLAIEASRPADLMAARNWFDGAALAAPDRIQEALARRVAGCRRRPIERDATIGVSSGPLLALYDVEDDMAWRAGSMELALAAESPPPAGTSFSVLIPEGGESRAPSPAGALPPPRPARPWAGQAGSSEGS